MHVFSYAISIKTWRLLQTSVITHIQIKNQAGNDRWDYALCFTSLEI